MKETDAQHDATKVSVMLEEGVYPAHIASFSVKEDYPTKVGVADIFDLTYKLAPDVAKMTQKCHTRSENGNFAINDSGNRIPLLVDGKQVEVSCEQFAGRAMYGGGLFLFKGSEGAGRNLRYTEFLDMVNIPVEEIDFEGHKVKKLMAIEEKDVVGKPIMVEVKYTESKAGKNKGKWFPNVVGMFKWESGKAIPVDEMLASDLPF